MNTNVLEYKGYFATVQYSREDALLYGKIEGINDLVTFDSESASGIEQSFHEAVDEYIDMCADIGKKPEKAYKGVFNVRISPEMHRLAAEEAIKTGVTLNQFVSSAIESKLANA